MLAPNVPAALLGLAIGILPASTVFAAQVRVTDEGGMPVVDAMVVCQGKETGAAGTGEDGIAQVPDACREVYCDRGDLVPDLVAVKEGKAACRLRAGLVLIVEIAAANCVEFCYAAVYDPLRTDGGNSRIAGGVPRIADTGELRKENGDGKLRRRLRPLLPGRYRLEIGRAKDGWVCGTDLGALPAGRRDVTVVWREPIEVKGRVLDREGKPVADVPLFVRVVEEASGSAVGAWSCLARQEGNEPVTREDGSFRVLVDPGAPVRIDAGWTDYPIGTASVSLRGAPDRELVLRLK